MVVSDAALHPLAVSSPPDLLYPLPWRIHLRK
jgi:hypothetical protein